MNRRIIIVLILVCISLSLKAQIARWLVQPKYDSIEMIDNRLLKVSFNGKDGFFNKEGNEVLPIEYDSITAFNEGLALLFKDNVFYGFTDTIGNVVPLQDYQLGPNIDRFYNGMLLTTFRGQYFFINKEGKEVFGPFAKAYPFFDGHACVEFYDKNKEETVYDCINIEGESFVLQKMDKKDINFMSSFHEGKAIIVIKKKFYKIDSKTYELTPISIDSTFRKKSLVVAEDKLITLTRGDKSYSVFAKNGKFVFDDFMRLKYEELLENKAKKYLFPSRKERIFESPFDKIFSGNKFGLKYAGKEVLPSQFENVCHLEDNLAIVKTKGKYGVITIDTENSFQFKLNNNENIGFNHQFYDAKLTVLMPPYVKCAQATVTSLSKDCAIQIESRTEKENVEGNALEYNCRLSIPDNLTDTLTRHDYFYSLKYDGLSSITHKVSTSEWYVKYYEVNLSNTNFTISSPNDTISVEFDLIKTDVAKSDQNNYFKNIEVIASNFAEQPILNKITENHYSFQVFGINQERINFSVRIKEVGCPIIEYPFEMVFVKPTPKEKDKKTIVKISPIQKKPVHLEKEIILLDD